LQEICKGGSIIETEARITSLRDADGLPIGLLGIQGHHRSQAGRGVVRGIRARYRLVVENAYELILVAQDGKFVFSNPKVWELSGYSEEEVTSRPFLEFVHPDDRQTAFELYQEVMGGEGARKARVFRVIDRWGKVRWAMWVLFVSSGMADSRIDFGIEITDLKQAEEALRGKRAEVPSVGRGSPFGLVLINEEGTSNT